MLSVTGIHRSKNTGFLLDCFADVRRRQAWTGLPLVIVLPTAWTTNVFRDKFGSPPDTVVLAEVSDDALRDLYIAADFLFQPSLYEGFGYPVAEAMHWGGAVIATRTAAIPEITGDAALLIDPTDREAGADAILHLATDTAARDRLRAAASVRAATFGDPAQLGAVTVACSARGSGDCGGTAANAHRAMEFNAAARLWHCGLYSGTRGCPRPHPGSGRLYRRQLHADTARGSEYSLPSRARLRYRRTGSEGQHLPAPGKGIPSVPLSRDTGAWRHHHAARYRIGSRLLRAGSPSWTVRRVRGPYVGRRGS